MNRVLRKSFSNRKISGVCGGLAEYINMDATIVRAIFLIAAILGLGSPALIYLVLWIVMPD